MVYVDQGSSESLVQNQIYLHADQGHLVNTSEDQQMGTSANRIGSNVRRIKLKLWSSGVLAQLNCFLQSVFLIEMYRFTLENNRILSSRAKYFIRKGIRRKEIRLKKTPIESNQEGYLFYRFLNEPR